jgi:hypothetical protein
MHLLRCLGALELKSGVVVNGDGGDATAAASPSSAGSFTDGISNDGIAYRLYKGSNAAWLYGERTLDTATARGFCRSAGGDLASFESAAESAEVVQLLSRSLGSRAGFQYGLDADFAMWIGLQRQRDGGWGWADGMRVGYRDWGGAQPSDWGDCGVLGWFWNRNAFWYAYPCGWSNMALAFLCKLPKDVQLPRGEFGLMSDA